MGVFGRLLRRARGAPPFAMDAALACAILLAGVFELTGLIHPSDWPKGIRQGFLPILLMVGWALPVAFRRKYLGAAYVVSRLAVLISILIWTVDSFTVAFVITQVVLVYSAAEQWLAPLAAAALVAENVINVALTLFPYREAFHISG